MRNANPMIAPHSSKLTPIAASTDKYTGIPRAPVRFAAERGGSVSSAGAR